MAPNNLLLREIPLKVTPTADGRYLLSVITENADGADATIGAKTDAAITNPSMAATLIALIKGVLTRLSGSTTLYAGTASLTTTAAAIAASQTVSETLIQADPANTVDILVGSSTSQSIRLRPGQPMIIPAGDLATVWAKAVSGTATLNYLGRS